MHVFICKSKDGNIIPNALNKKAFLRKLLNSYEELDMKFKVTIEVIEKNINDQQISLYNAFIIKASNHFGISFREMELMLKALYPMDHIANDYKPKNKWTTVDLNNFIEQASALLAEQGFKFE